MKIYIFVSIFFLFFAGSTKGAEKDYKKVKPVRNVILMIPDGTPTGLLSVTRWVNWYKELTRTNLSIDPYLCGFVRSNTAIGPIADSGSSASCYLSGHVQPSGFIGTYSLDYGDRNLGYIDSTKAYGPVANVIEAAQQLKGKSTGLVVTVNFTHATPADCGAHFYNRDRDDVLASQIVHNNFDVVLNYNKSKQQALMIQNKNPNHISIYQADVSQYDDILNLVNYTIDTYGHIDLLVNNAGISIINTIDHTSNEDFDKIIKTNLYSAFYCSREVSKNMVKNKNGLIINISSIWGITGSSCEVAYSISKAGMDGLTKSLAKELGPSNIRVNSIAPGIIDTEMNQSLNETDKTILLNEIPLRKLGTTSDIANCVLDLFNSPYITGQIIQVNGGWNI